MILMVAATTTMKSFLVALGRKGRENDHIYNGPSRSQFEFLMPCVRIKMRTEAKRP